MTNLAVVDVGTSGLRAAIVDERLTIRALEHRPFPPSSPSPGLVEFDAAELAATVLDAARAAIETVGEPIDAVGITNQRASAVVWDRATGEPVGPGIGWQDLRTVVECITAKAEHGWSIAPNQAVTKLAWILEHTPGLDGRELCFGTVDSWVAWTLTGGAAHVSDQTNASAMATGLLAVDGSGWNHEVLQAFGIPEAILPTVVDSIGASGEATALPGSPPITAMLGDQQASLVGQGAVRPGLAKITFGTGGMLDVCTGGPAPSGANRATHGTYPLPLWSRGGTIEWGVEGIMLSAGTNVEWLREDLGLIETAADSHDVASACDDAGGVVYVPALLGLGTPQWDYGARGTLLGLTRGSDRRHVVRAVLEGVAHRGADLVDAAVADTGVEVASLRVDGGMSQNPTFVQALADVAQRPVEVSPVVEATTIGAAFLAGVGVGVWPDVATVGDLWQPAHRVEPRAGVDHAATRATWRRALERAGGWLPDLSALDF